MVEMRNGIGGLWKVVAGGQKNKQLGSPTVE